jgi:hypothetical protein
MSLEIDIGVVVRDSHVVMLYALWTYGFMAFNGCSKA